MDTAVVERTTPNSLQRGLQHEGLFFRVIWGAEFAQIPSSSQEQCWDSAHPMADSSNIGVGITSSPPNFFYRKWREIMCSCPSSDHCRISLGDSSYTCWVAFIKGPASDRWVLFREQILPLSAKGRDCPSPRSFRGPETQPSCEGQWGNLAWPSKTGAATPFSWDQPRQIFLSLKKSHSETHKKPVSPIPNRS